jgi:DNA-binding CsgD family transcriptional regulator
MLYRELADVSSYIHDSSRDLIQILQMLCIKALGEIEADALVYVELDHNGYVVTKSSFGIELQNSSGEQARFHLSERTPFTDSIRENKVVLVNSLPQWPKLYSSLKSLTLPQQCKSVISAPIEISGLPIGSLIAFSRIKIDIGEELIEFLKALTIILSPALHDSRISRVHEPKLDGTSSISNFAKPSTEDIDKPFSERQMLILKMISEGRTNAAIADVLGYSESLIRQETIKIYAKLQCSGRNEAAQKYHRLIAEESSVAI